MNQERRSTIKETVIRCVEAPRLKGVSTRNFIEFKGLRELYKKQIEEKGRQPQEEVITTSYRACIEDHELEIFLAAGWIEAPSIDKLTEAQIQQCIDERCKKDVNGEELYPVDQAVRLISMNMNMEDAEDRVWSLRRDHANTLRAAGYRNIIEERPHIAMNHLLRKLKPVQLYQRMLDIITWRKNKGFRKENFNCFVRDVAAQADKLQTEQSEASAPHRKPPKEPNHQMRSATHGIRRKEAQQEAVPERARHRNPNEPKQDTNKKRKRDVYETPLCLNPECKAKGRRHYIRKCDISSDEAKTKLLEQYRQAKRARLDDTRKNSSSVNRIVDTPSSPHSSIFKASLARRNIETKTMADRGADANFISAKLLDEIKQKMGNIQQETWNPLQTFCGVAGDPCLTCASSVKLDVFLQTCRGTRLVLRNIQWKVTKEDLTSPIIGRKVLESLGCDNREMLIAARDKYGDDIDVTKRLEDDGNEEVTEGKIAALFGESLFHSSGMIEDDGLEKHDMYVDLADNQPHAVDEELAMRVEEATQNGMSKEGAKRLRKFLESHRLIFRIRLGSGGPAKVKPMKIVPDETKKPVKVKVRKYPAEQRRFLNLYIDKLVEMVFLKTCPQASWQAAPHLVPKDSKSKFRTTIDLRPVNAATKAEKWPMPVIEAEVSDFSGSTHFASLDFCSGYWQCPLDPSSYDACGIIAPQGTFDSTRVLHGLKNASAYFQSTIPPLFDSIKHAFKAGIDDFTIHTQSESNLNDILEQFFEICAQHNLRLSAKKSVFLHKESQVVQKHH